MHSASASEGGQGAECSVAREQLHRGLRTPTTCDDNSCNYVTFYVDYVDMVYIIMIYIFSLSMETVNIPFPSEMGEVVLVLYVVLVSLLL